MGDELQLGLTTPEHYKLEQLQQQIAQLQQELAEEKELRIKAEALAMLDPLTRIPNRRYLEQEIPMLFAEVARGQIMLAIVFVDVDDFKHVNDTLGHDAGDQVLLAIVKALQAVTRDTDTLVRYGGDEFVLALPFLPSEYSDVNTEAHVQGILDRYRAVVGETVSRSNSPSIHIPQTISIGCVVIMPKNDVEPSMTLAMADKNVQKSKANGKNRATVTIYQPAQPLTGTGAGVEIDI